MFDGMFDAQSRPKNEHQWAGKLKAGESFGFAKHLLLLLDKAN